MRESLGLIISLCLLFGQLAQARVFHLQAYATNSSNKFLGEWKVISRVIWSDSPYVQEGLEAQTQINISSIQGSLHPNWVTEKWITIRDKIIDFKSDDTMYWEQDSKLVNGREYWFVQSLNQFDFKDNNYAEGTSQHKQYLNGEYVGRYITKSYLSKIQTEAKEFISLQ